LPQRVNLLNLALILSLAISGTLSVILIPVPAATGATGMPTVTSGEVTPDRAPSRVKRQRSHGGTQQNRQQQSKSKVRKQQTRKADSKSKHKKKKDSSRSAGGGQSVKDHFIVVLKPSAGSPERAADAVASESADVTVTQVYDQVLDGFAAVIPEDQVDDVRNDPRVQEVVPDQEVHAFGQTLPTGVDRIDDDQNPKAKIDGSDERVDADVAVLDTGIAKVPDLNVVDGKSCINGTTGFGDDNGHGTHVAGTIGALDNDTGVVGVAPGARLWAIKVLDGQGNGSWSSVICGLDWVYDNRGTIDVVNMSLGGDGADGPCAETPLHGAICRVVDVGVSVVVAAGNDSRDAGTVVPAAYDEVITVSALVDTDGKAGGAGGSTSVGADDTRASFSNFGPDVDIAAPGVRILSTAPGGGTQQMSGTSMASPHVAGAVALYLADNHGTSPARVKDALIGAREVVAGITEGVLYDGNGFAPSPSTVSPAPTSKDGAAAPNKKKGKHKKHKGKHKKKRP